LLPEHRPNILKQRKETILSQGEAVLPDILVTGATGTFGGEVTRQLQSRGKPIRVLVRDAAKVSELNEAVQVVVGDFARPETLDAALRGIECVFLASFDSPDQAKLQNNVLTAAKRHGVRHIVRISTGGVNELRHLSIFDWHYECEQQLEESGLAFTHLRPGWVMQNFLPSSWAGPDIDGKIRLPAGDGHISFVDARDIAAVGVEALTKPGHEGKAYEMTGAEALSHSDIADQLSAATGRSIVYENVSPETYEQELTAQGWPRGSIETMLALFTEIRVGNESVVFDTVETVTGRAPFRFQKFANDYASVFKAGY
jgi:uncharacterized protein YbjT (DUF2867 family)